MKTLFIATFLTCCYLISSCATHPESKEAIPQEIEYVVISNEKFAEIEAKMNLQEDWNPIIIEGFSKSELVAFYIQSYSEEIISTWADFAYKKMHRFEEAKPSEDQETAFKKILELPRSAENMHRFMMLMTTKQIETVGY